ncbi:MAG: hypothetical protein AAFN10_23045 [Bacteroidota bacterium]
MFNAKTNRSAKLAILIVLIGLAGCIQLRPISLYDGKEAAPVMQKPEAIAKIVDPILYQDDTLNVWGILTDSCKNFQLVEDVKYSGTAGLKLKWERQGCEWIGFGMGWDDYSGKDLQPLMEYAAFQMHVRTPKGKSFGLPFVLTLEDYSGEMSFCYTANKYFERTTIDEEWQKVTVPLKDFDDEGVGFDYGNIKQLQIEMQQAGEVYLDEIKLVFYEEVAEEPWLAEDVLPDPKELPIKMFEDDFINQDGWGLIDSDCQKVQVSSAEAFAGGKSIHASWDYTGEKCSLPFFGVSWAKWQAVDVRPIVESAKLSFYIKSDQLDELSFQVYLEDFNRSTSAVIWDPAWAKAAKNGWYKVEIPMIDFFGVRSVSEIKGSNASDGSGSAGGPRNLEPSIIKTIAFRLEGKGEMFIDQLRWE